MNEKPLGGCLTDTISKRLLISTGTQQPKLAEAGPGPSTLASMQKSALELNENLKRTREENDKADSAVVVPQKSGAKGITPKGFQSFYPSSSWLTKLLLRHPDIDLEKLQALLHAESSEVEQSDNDANSCLESEVSEGRSSFLPIEGKNSKKRKVGPLAGEDEDSYSE